MSHRVRCVVDRSGAAEEDVGHEVVWCTLQIDEHPARRKVAASENRHRGAPTWVAPS